MALFQNGVHVADGGGRRRDRMQGQGKLRTEQTAGITDGMGVVNTVIRRDAVQNFIVIAFNLVAGFRRHTVDIALGDFCSSERKGRQNQAGIQLARGDVRDDGFNTLSGGFFRVFEGMPY